MWAQAEGFAASREEGPAPGHAFAVHLSPEAAIVGKVVRADGSPLAGARVAVNDRAWDDPMFAVRSAADGSFRVGGLAKGEYRTWAQADDAYGEASKRVHLAMGETAEVAITTRATVSVSGRVVTADGEACAAGTVYLSRETDKVGRRGDIGADGRAWVQGLDPGVYQVSAQCEGMLRTGTPHAPVEVAEHGVHGLAWTVAPGSGIRGVVVDAAGAPVPEVEVEAFAYPQSEESGTSRQPSITRTDADGAFAIGGLIPGPYRLELQSWEMSRPKLDPGPEVQVAADTVAEVRLQLAPTAELRGRVRDTNGAPAAQVEVELSTDAASVLTADDGTYVFPYAPAGATEVYAWASGVRGESKARTLEAGERATIDLTIPARTERISGRVLAAGRPVAGARIDLKRDGWTPYTSMELLPRLSQLRTGDDGTFTLTGLASGRYEVLVERVGGGEVRGMIETGKPAVLHIEVPASVAGTVRVRSRGAPDEFSLSIHDQNSDHFLSERFTGGTRRFPEVPPGEYEVLVTIAGQSAKSEVKLEAGQALTGVDLEVEPSVMLRGTLIDEAGAPIVGVEVYVHGEGTSTTDAAGRFEFETKPGQWSIQVQGWKIGVRGFDSGVVLPGDGFGEYRRTIVLHDDPAEVELAPIRMVQDRIKHRGWMDQPGGDLGYRAEEPHSGERGERGGPKVREVTPGEHAARAGLRVGDEIVAVDGIDVTGDNRWLYRRLRRVPVGATITLTLARGVSVQLLAIEPRQPAPGCSDLARATCPGVHVPVHSPARRSLAGGGVAGPAESRESSRVAERCAGSLNVQGVLDAAQACFAGLQRRGVVLGRRDRRGETRLDREVVAADEAVEDRVSGERCHVAPGTLEDAADRGGHEILIEWVVESNAYRVVAAADLDTPPGVGAPFVILVNVAADIIGDRYDQPFARRKFEGDTAADDRLEDESSEDRRGVALRCGPGRTDQALAFEAEGQEVDRVRVFNQLARPWRLADCGRGCWFWWMGCGGRRILGRATGEQQGEDRRARGHGR